MKRSPALRVLIAPSGGHNEHRLRIVPVPPQLSSSPPAGVTTRSRGRGRQPPGGVLIAPSGGHNTGHRYRPRPRPAGPHRPQRGSQRTQPGRGRGGRGRPHRPQRGSQQEQHVGAPVLGVGPHRPQRGSQLAVFQAPEGRERASSSPPAGVTTGPLRGGGDGLRLVLIAPSGGHNAAIAARSRYRTSSPHRPQRGSQLDGEEARASYQLRPHRPQRGSQRSEDHERVVRGDGSSSPPAGVTTCRTRRPTSRRPRVLIAPSGGHNPVEAAGG